MSRGNASRGQFSMKAHDGATPRNRSNYIDRGGHAVNGAGLAASACTACTDQGHRMDGTGDCGHTGSRDEDELSLDNNLRECHRICLIVTRGIGESSREVASMRNELAAQRHSFHRRAESANETVAAFAEHLSAVRPVESFVTELLQKLQSDVSNLQSLRNDMRVAETKLLDTETCMIDRMEVLSSALATLRGSNGAYAANSSDLGSNSLGLRETAEEHPALVSEYYDWKGDLGILRERLDDLDYEYQEELLGRPTSLVINHECEHRLEYGRRREQLLHDINALEAKCEQLRNECKSTGYTLDSDSISIRESQVDYGNLEQTGKAKVTYIVPGHMRRTAFSTFGEESVRCNTLPMLSVLQDSVPWAAPASASQLCDKIQQWLDKVTLGLDRPPIDTVQDHLSHASCIMPLPRHSAHGKLVNSRGLRRCHSEGCITRAVTLRLYGAR